MRYIFPFLIFTVFSFPGFAARFSCQGTGDHSGVEIYGWNSSPG